MIVLGIFSCIELLNIIMLYTKPEVQYGNGVGVFKAWEESKENPVVHRFIRYLVFWVAGTKLIFVGLIIIIILYGNWIIQLAAVTVLLLTTSTFFVRLYPIIKNMDKQKELTVTGYSKKLALMISFFLLMLLSALLLEKIGLI
jgi:hypothetical protein